MKLVLFVAFCLVSFASGSAVVDLKDSTFDDFLKTHSYFFVKFYAPWCGHCKRLEPVYEEIAVKLASENIALAQVNCDEEKVICEKYNVNGFPTLKHFKSGNAIDYEGGRDFDSLSKSIRGYSGPAARVLANEEQFEKFVGAGDATVVGFYKDENDAKAFLENADVDFMEIRFAVVYNMDLIKAKNDGYGVVCFRTFEKEEPKLIYKGALDNKTALRTFARESSVPLSRVYTKSLATNYATLGRPRLSWVGTIDVANDSAGVRYILNRLRTIAREFAGKFSVTAQSKNDEDVEELEIKEGRFCVFDEKKKYCSDETEFSLENAKQFAQSYLDGKVSLFIKSEPIPTLETPVKKIVGKTFAKEVMEAKEDVFIKFYAPWCGHCKTLEPIYKELAEKMEKYKSVKIAEIDATNNDYDDVFTVQGYPTMYLLLANDKTHPIKYEGERDVKSMMKWLKKQTDIKKEL